MPKIVAVKIDEERCIGCGSCVALAPEAFAIGLEEGKAEVKGDWGKVPPEKLRCARDACPVQAIILKER